MNSIGTINTFYTVEFKENCNNYENLDNKFIVKVKSSNLNDVIILFKELNFEQFIREAFNCFIVCVQFDSNGEEEDDDDDEYTAMRLEGTFKADRLIILQLNGNLWMKKSLQKKFFNIKSPKMKKYYKLLEDINYDGDFLKCQLDFLKAIDWIKPETEDFVIKIIKLFKFDNQKEVDKKLLDKAFEQKCSNGIFQSMISFHKNTDGKLKGMNKYEVDALFLAKGITVFGEETIKNYRQELSREDKEKITDEILKFQKNQKSLLHHLCSRSIPALTTEDTKIQKEKIYKRYYKHLIDLNLDSVTDLLKIVDHKLLILFDFDSNSIESNYLMASSHNRGIFDQDRMRIDVGAKNSHEPSNQNYLTREWEIIGILIHEICHYVNFKVFNNNCKPYHKDGKDINDYEEIVNEYKIWTDHNEIVGRVFTDYEDTMWHAELIVRVIQMIVTYKILDPKQLGELEIKYHKLFTYFNDKVMPQIKHYIDPDYQLKRQIMEISSFRADQIELKPVMKSINYNNEKFIHFIETNSPKLALANFIKNFENDFVIFTSFKKLTDEIKGNNILQLWCSDWRIKIVIYADQIDESLTQFEDCIKKLDNPDRLNHIFIIFEEQSYNQSKLTGKFTRKIEVLEKLNFSFTDLTKESKDKIFQKNVIFQGTQTTINSIITKDSNAAQFLPINHFIESSDPIVIGRLPEKNADYDDKIFIQRKLTNKNEQIKKYSTGNMDEILELMSIKKYLIISDEVGKGKSTLMTHLAYQFLHSTLSHINGEFFVVKINLHQHVNELEGYKNEMDLNRFIFEKFITNSDFCEFEWKIFEEFYQDGKLILMLDGFDEIAGSSNNNKYDRQNCEECTIKIIQEINKLNKSNLIVASRPLFISKLNLSGAFILNLLPLSFFDQRKFLIDSLMSNVEIRESFQDQDITNVCHNSLLKMINSVKETRSIFPDFLCSSEFINSMMSFPLHLKMFGNFICNRILEKGLTSMNDDKINEINFNIYNLYDDFFQTKQSIAIDEKGRKVKGEINDAERKGIKKLDFSECAEKLAWNTIHPTFKSNPITINDMEKRYLQRYGIVTMQNNEIDFIHRAYAEYFIAHMFLKSIIDGTLSSSNFARKHFWIDVLTLVDYETIKSLIDTALSDDNIYHNISKENFEELGKFIIKEFEELEGEDKHFLFCIIEHEKKNIPKIGLRKDFVFISHLLLESLTYCDSEEEIKSIKKILEISSVNSQPESYSNIFHLSCSLGINCLVTVIWELAKKTCGINAKQYFLKPQTIFEVTNVLVIALDLKTISFLHSKKCFVKIRNCLKIEELRSMKDLGDEENIDLNKEQNFQLSTVFLLLQILQDLNLAEDELESISPLKFNNLTDSTMLNIFLKFNTYQYFLNNFINPKGLEISNNFKLKVVYIFVLIVEQSFYDESIMIEFSKFLKAKLLNEYEIFIKYFFQMFFERSKIPFEHWPLYKIEQKGNIIYSELKNVLNNESNISYYFLYNSQLTSAFFSKNYTDISLRLQKYFKILSDDHLIHFLSNESLYNINIINYVVLKFSIEDLQNFLQTLKSRFSDKIKLYCVIKKFDILANPMKSEQKFLLIYEFCKQNLEKREMQKMNYNIMCHFLKFYNQTQ